MTVEGLDLNELSIVLPIFNEAGVVENMIRSIHRSIFDYTGNFEIIAVNDGSSDDTSIILNQMALSLPQLRIVSHQTNIGYGGALISGIKKAQKAWILLMDADEQFHIDSLRAVWNLRNEYDVFLGYRQKRADSFYRLFMGKSGNALANLLLGRSIRDINCGFKLFKRETIKPLSLSSTGGIFNFELLYRLFKGNRLLKVKQFPVSHYPRKQGLPTGGSFKVIFRIITEGFRVLLKKS